MFAMDVGVAEPEPPVPVVELVVEDLASAANQTLQLSRFYKGLKASFSLAGVGRLPTSTGRIC